MLPSTSATCIRRQRHKVFLSFRGKDTRKKFVGHLYAALEGHDIPTFIDDGGLKRGSHITTALSEAIEGSQIAVIVFSKNYADSPWCLDELLKIRDCYEKNGMKVLPVFYDVNPSDVRNQKGDFGEAFSQHTDAENVDLWREALAYVGGIAGWDLNDSFGSHEANCIKNIVESILCELNFTAQCIINENIIGAERRVRKFMSCNLGIRSDLTCRGIELPIDKVSEATLPPKGDCLLFDEKKHDVRMIGILGIPGSGKTTIAKAVFYSICLQFEGYSFVENISEVSKNHDLAFLQNQLLSSVLGHTKVQAIDNYDGCRKIKWFLGDKKVLIVLDKVDEEKQLKALAGKLDWFGDGSRIIITTTDKQLLLSHKIVDSTYNVTLLDDEEAMELFNCCAFQNGIPTEAHKESLDRVIRYAAGHPGALKCLGSKLIDRPIDQWKCILDSLAVCLESGIGNMLKSSLDGLNSVDRELFLDLACFFNGWVKAEVINILDSCGLFATSGLTTLERKSLITCSGEFVQMHPLLQEMGRDIVRKVHPDEPGRHSRLWLLHEIKEILEESKGTEEIKAMVVSNLHKLDARKAFDAFTSMKKLRLLHANTQKTVSLGPGPTPYEVEWSMQGYGNLKYLPCDLRWLTWDHYNLDSLPKNFFARKIAGLQLRYSSIVDLCSRRDMKFLNKLRFLDLSYSKDLIRTPDVGCLPLLESVNLEFCPSLLEVHLSIGVHSSLVHLNLRFCENLESFPSIIEMASLEVLNLSACSKLTKIPEFVSMDNLLELDLSHNSIEKLPSSIGDLPKLNYLDVCNCRNLTCIPKSIDRLDGLEIIFYGCQSLQIV